MDCFRENFPDRASDASTVGVFAIRAFPEHRLMNNGPAGASAPLNSRIQP